MMHRSRIVTAAAILLFAVAGASWYFGSPSWTLSRMKAAAQKGDARALSAYVDYPALRQSIKSELVLKAKMAAERDSSGIGELGSALAGSLIDPLVDRLVSPAGLQAALASGQDGTFAVAGAGALNAIRVPEKPVITRLNFSEFLVASSDRPMTGLLFKRHGLSWRLSGVELAQPPREQAAGGS